jgi:general stress protein YciG
MNFDPQSDKPQTSESPKVDSAPSATEVPNQTPNPKPRRPRGFAAMDRSKVSEIASKGGKAAHAAGTAHQFTSDEARDAGRKGGVAPHVRRGRGPRVVAASPVASSESGEEAKST